MNLKEKNPNKEMITWNGVSIEKGKMTEICRSTNKITWYISSRCNFKCDYCGEWLKDQHNLKPIDVVRLSESLDYLKKDWMFYISGGEPFLEKNFVDICREITKKHYLSFSSNLSTANVFDFADKIDPDRCLFINASIHVTEREKTDPRLSSFIEKLLYLQKKGFNVIAVYVAHPLLFGRIKQDLAFLKTHGIEKARTKIFFGDYQGKYYPWSLNAGQKEFLETMEADYPEFEIMNHYPDFYGQMCIAGQKSFAMDRNGNLKRCSSVLKNHGNFFEKSIKFDKKIKPCPKKKYDCPHECLEFNLGTKGNVISVLNEDIIEKSLGIKKIKVTRRGIINKFWQLAAAIEKAGIPLNKLKKLFKNNARIFF